MGKEKSIFNHFFVDLWQRDMRREYAEQIRLRLLHKMWVERPQRQTVPEYELRMVEAGYDQAMRDFRVGKYASKREMNKL